MIPRLEFEGSRRKDVFPRIVLVVYGNVREHGVVGTTGPPLFSLSIQFFVLSWEARSGLPEKVKPLAQSAVFASVVNCPIVLFEQRSKAFGSTNPCRTLRVMAVNCAESMLAMFVALAPSKNDLTWAAVVGSKLLPSPLRKHKFRNASRSAAVISA